MTAVKIVDFCNVLTFNADFWEILWLLFKDYIIPFNKLCPNKVFFHQFENASFFFLPLGLVLLYISKFECQKKKKIKVKYSKYDLMPQNFRQTGVVDLTGGRKDYTAILKNKDDALK